MTKQGEPFVSSGYLLLDASGGRGTLARRLGGELLARGLASGRFASGLLGTSHGFSLEYYVSSLIVGSRK